MELSQEHFDQQLTKLESKISNIIDAKIEILESKMETRDNGIKTYIHEAFETQQEYIDERFSELATQMQIQERLARHDSWLHTVADKVGIKLSV